MISPKERPQEIFRQGEVRARASQVGEDVTIEWRMPLAAAGGTLHLHVTREVETWADARRRRSGWYDLGKTEEEVRG